MVRKTRGKSMIDCLHDLRTLNVEIDRRRAGGLALLMGELMQARLGGENGSGKFNTLLSRSKVCHQTGVLSNISCNIYPILKVKEA